MTAKKPCSDEQMITTAENELKIVDLKRSGLSFRKIAALIGMSHSGVAEAFDRVMTRTEEETREAMKHYRALSLERWESDFQALDGAAAEGNVQAIAVRDRLISNMVALLGVASPVKFQSDSRVEVIVTGADNV